MPKLNLTLAQRIKSAAGELLQLKGAGFAWAKPGPPPSGMIWLAGFRSTVVGNTATSTSPQFGQAYSAPIGTGRVYVEMGIDDYQPNNRVGLWPFASVPPADPGVWGALGQSISPGCGINGDGPWSNHCFFDDVWTTTGDPDTSMDPARRWGFAIHGPSVWIRQVWIGGASPFYGGGDPVTGTAPTGVIDSALPLHLAASSTDGGSGIIYAPADHLAAAPAGFTAI